MKPHHRATQLALSVVLAAALAACSDAEPKAADVREPTVSPAAEESSPTAASSSPIDGTWRIEHSKAELVANMEKHGFGKWTQDFLDTEKNWAHDNWVWTFSLADMWFEGKWQNPDGTWKSAWYGPMAVKGDTVVLTDAVEKTVDTLRWKVDGDQLRLTYVKTDGPQLVKGIPEPVYFAAYLADPLKRAKCPAAAEPCS